MTICHPVAGSSTHKAKFLTKQGKPARNITAAQYATVIKDTFLPEGRRLLQRNGVTRWVLPDTLDYVDIRCNEGMKIKYLGWLFGGRDDYSIIWNDIYKDILLPEYLRARLHDLCEAGNTYIDVHRLHDDEYCKSLGLSLTPVS